MQDGPIGIFDSGVGGMTVARAIEQLCPEYPLIYFGDIARGVTERAMRRKGEVRIEPGDAFGKLGVIDLGIPGQEQRDDRDPELAHAARELEAGDAHHAALDRLGDLRLDFGRGELER